MEISACPPQETAVSVQDSTLIDAVADIPLQCNTGVLPSDFFNNQTELEANWKDCQSGVLHKDNSHCNTERHTYIEVGHQCSQADLDSDGNLSQEKVHFNQIVDNNNNAKTQTNINIQYESQDQDHVGNVTTEYLEQGHKLTEDCNQFQQAEEIVKKLCKNGKVMQFHEGDDFIKVIVYEDSAEGEDAEETESAEEFESVNEADTVLDHHQINQGGSEKDGAKNLLDCLIENENGKRHQDSEYTHEDGSDPFKRPRTALSSDIQTYDVIADSSSHRSKQNVQWCQSGPIPSAMVSQSMTQASVIQSNFNQTVNKFGSSFMTCNVADLEPVEEGHLCKQETDEKFEPQQQQEGRMYTPHPKNGYMYYVSEELGAADGMYRPSPLIDTITDRTNIQMATPGDRRAATFSSTVHLNSSGEENVSPTDLMDTPTGPQSQQRQLQKKIRSLIQLPDYQTDELGKLREQHNQKERKRRARIKEACNLLRQLVPGMSDKTDKATVFEFAARYVHFLKSHTGSQFDTDFLMKYSPY